MLTYLLTYHTEDGGVLGASVALAGQPMALPPFFYLSLFGTVGAFFQAD